MCGENEPDDSPGPIRPGSASTDPPTATHALSLNPSDLCSHEEFLACMGPSLAETGGPSFLFHQIKEATDYHRFLVFVIGPDLLEASEKGLLLLPPPECSSPQGQ